MAIVSLGKLIDTKSDIEYRSYRPAGLVSCHKVYVECHYIAGCVDLDIVDIILVLVTAALVQVALVICVRNLDRVFDWAGGI